MYKNAVSNIEQVLGQHSTKQQLYDHLPPIEKNIQVRWTRHAGRCWGSWDELINDILLWTPSHGWAKAGQPARNYIQQLCADAGCSLEDIREAMDNREGWWERVRDIRADGATWWWWWWWYINLANQYYAYVQVFAVEERSQILPCFSLQFFSYIFF